MSTFPKIDGITWMDESYPDIISIRVTLVDRIARDLDLKIKPTMPDIVYIDLSKLAGVKYWYPEGSDEPHPTESSVDVDGVDNFIADVSVKNMLEAWIFYKRFKYSYDTRNI